MAVRLAQRTGPKASLVIRGARVLDPAAGIDEVRDLVVRDGVIGGDAKGLEEIDGTGLLALPGFVDPHVHLRTPGREDLETIATGTLAAASGGFVTIVSMPNTVPVIDTAPVLSALLDQGDLDAVIRVGFYAAITVGQSGNELTEQAELAEVGAAGFSDDGYPVSDARVMRRALQYQQITGLPLVLHEEDRHLSGRGVVHEGAVASRLGLEGIPRGLREHRRRARRGAGRVRERAHPHLPRLGGRRPSRRSGAPSSAASGSPARSRPTTWRSPTTRSSRSTRAATR